jgi:uncharacterized protein Yka (UPF0111/DUF47 family)
MINIFPKDGLFYELFEKQTEKLNEAASLLRALLEDPSRLKEIASKLKELEIEADDVGHQVMDHLRKNFITPMEGEDIDLLRQNLDDIMDYIERSVNRIGIYRIRAPFPKEIGEYIGVISGAVAEINDGMKELKNIKKFGLILQKRCVRLNELENVGDDINRKALGDLMGMQNVTCDKLMEVIKLKEIYETLENAIDCCENVGNLFESIIIKSQ